MAYKPPQMLTEQSNQLFTYGISYIEDSGHMLISLNSVSQKRINNNKREIHPLILKEIKRLRIKECPKYGKSKSEKESRYIL